MDNLEWLKNLMIMAAADRKLADEEMEYLERRSREWNIDPEEYAAALQYACDEEAVLSLPIKQSKLLQFLRELIQVMAVDGELADVEKQLFALAAARMGVNDMELDEIFDSLG